MSCASSSWWFASGCWCALAIALAPVIHHFGMIGAAVTAVLGDLTERLIVGRKVCQTIDATWHDVRLLSGVLRVAAVAAVAALVAYGVRNAAATQPLFARLAMTGISFGVVYLAGFYLWQLPGCEIVSQGPPAGLCAVRPSATAAEQRRRRAAFGFGALLAFGSCRWLPFTICHHEAVTAEGSALAAAIETLFTV